MTTSLWQRASLVSWVTIFAAIACGSDDSSTGNSPTTPKDPTTAAKVSVDRFSAAAGHLMVRDASHALPAPDAPIDFDQGEPFITRGLGPAGQKVRYYNFDVQRTTPAPIYVLFKPGATTPVAGQLNIVDVIPGDFEYNDFWLVTRVNVPADYAANTVTSLSDIEAAGYTTQATDMLVNCPVVPDGSTATLRADSEPNGLMSGWYRGEVVEYFSFSEHPLTAVDGQVPVSPIYVAFNANPADPGGGPASGFKTEAGSVQTHNVVATIPDDAAYSPLWMVDVYDNAGFEQVSNLAEARAQKVFVTGAGNVNCPIVSIAP